MPLERNEEERGITLNSAMQNHNLQSVAVIVLL